MQQFVALTSLTKLSLQYCDNISDKSAKALGNLMALRDIDLCAFKKITNDGVKHLEPLPSFDKAFFCVIAQRSQMRCKSLGESDGLEGP